MSEKTLIYCLRCKKRSEMVAERVEWEKPRRKTYGYKGVCSDCGRDCYRFAGNSKWEGGATPHKIRDQNYRDRKKQKDLYDPIENLPKLKAYYSPE